MKTTSMRSIPRWLAAVAVGALVVLGSGCKEKEPEPERPKVTRPKLPEYGK
jgi:hypothetical protein